MGKWPGIKDTGNGETTEMCVGLGSHRDARRACCAEVSGLRGWEGLERAGREGEEGFQANCSSPDMWEWLNYNTSLRGGMSDLLFLIKCPGEGDTSRACSAAALIGTWESACPEVKWLATWSRKAGERWQWDDRMWTWVWTGCTRSNVSEVTIISQAYIGVRTSEG